MITYFCVFDDLHGSCVASGECLPEQVAGQAGIGQSVLIVDNYIPWNQAYLVGDQVFDAGPAPTENHKLTRFGDWVLDVDALSVAHRRTRDLLLFESDWTDTVSAQLRLSPESLEAWGDYRQSLRDITEQPGYPHEVVWPIKPT